MDSIVHFEIPYDNETRVGNFYRETFGWQIERVPNMNYTIARTTPVDEKFMPKERGAINGGMLKREGMTKNVVITINVDSIDQAHEKIEPAGGRIIREKKPVGDMGFASYFEDTEGNVIGLWETKK